jgi:hypothetical protein
MKDQNQSQVEFTAEDLNNLDKEIFGTEEEATPDNPLEEFEETQEEEQKEEEKPELEEKEETPPEEKKEEPKTTSEYTEIAKDFIESGDWEDVIIEGEGEEEDKKLSELIEEGKVDKATFLSVKKEMDKAKEEKLKNNYIKVEGLEESKRKLIEIIKEGKTEEVRNLLTEEPDILEEPFKGFDNDNDAHNEHVLTWYYKAKGNNDSETQALVEKAKKDLSMDSIAAEVVEKAREQHKLKLDKKAEELKSQNQEEEQALKEYKKDLKQNLKELGIKDTTIKKFTDFATQTNEEGMLPVDSMFEEIMSDPKKASDFIYYMLEPEDFIKKKSESLLKTKSIDDMRKIKRLQQEQKSKGTSNKIEEPSKKPKGFLDELELELQQELT